MTAILNCENLISPNINEVKTNICSIENLKSITYNNTMCNLMEINICSVQIHFDELCILLDNSSI